MRYPISHLGERPNMVEVTVTCIVFALWLTGTLYGIFA